MNVCTIVQQLPVETLNLLFAYIQGDRATLIALAFPKQSSLVPVEVRHDSILVLALDAYTENNSTFLNWLLEKIQGDQEFLDEVMATLEYAAEHTPYSSGCSAA